MSISKIQGLAMAAIMVVSASVGANAQLKLPKSHNQQHNFLLANQRPFSLKHREAAKRELQREVAEREDEADIFGQYWNSDRVNPYGDVVIPATKNIDVTGFCAPVRGEVTSPYGWRPQFGRMHRGTDLRLSVGDTVRAAFDGRVRVKNFERRGYGNYLVVRHTNDLETVYGHLSAFLVEPGQYVKAGDPIALGGNTGRSTGPHLHFETRYMGYAINPCAIFDFANQTTHTDTYTFDKRTYQEARNYDPAANTQYAQRYMRENPPRPYSRRNHGNNNDAPATYRVRRGDSLSRIASRHGTTVNRLCRLNGITTTTKLQIGQRLRLR